MVQTVSQSLPYPYDSIEQEAILICARLMRQGYVKKEEFRNLELNERLLQQVHYRLAQVGMKLVMNTYSPYYAVRLLPEIQENLDESNSLGLKSNEIAMLVILWCKLILPKRLSLESQANLATENKSKPLANTEVANNSSTSELANKSQDTPIENLDTKEIPLKEERATSVSQNGTDKTAVTTNSNPLNDEIEVTKYYIKMSELWAEFGEHFGNKTLFKATLTRLNNLQFIRVRDEIISEGILLDLLIDSHQMANEVKRSALAYKLAGLQEADEDSNEVDEADDDETLPTK